VTSEATKLKEQENIQPKVNEKSQLKRRVLMFVTLIVALLMVMAITVYLINSSFTPPSNCPWTRQQCLTQPYITKFYIPNFPRCFEC
jgi:cell division septal protein FtsQ